MPEAAGHPLGRMSERRDTPSRGR